MQQLKFDRERLYKARRLARERFVAAAIEETPASIRYIIPQRNLTGRAYRDHIKAPKPVTRKALYISPSSQSVTFRPCTPLIALVRSMGLASIASPWVRFKSATKLLGLSSNDSSA
jgi:hypothetical protein